MDQPPLPIPEDLQKAAKIFSEAGRQCWLVGGAVRDGILGRSSDDFDLATDAHPEEVQRIFRRTIPTGMQHGTITVLLGTHQFETTTFRRDGDYSDGRRPDSISYADNILEDLARRDFTINSIAYDLINRKLTDPHDGRGDIRKKIIRAIGNPSDRLEEDGLRSIRACRIAGQLDFTIEEDTKNAIATNQANIPGLSAERIWMELKKIMSVPRPSISVELFRETGLLKVLLPELQSFSDSDYAGYRQNLRSCDALEAGNIPLRFAALLRDIGSSVKTSDNSNDNSQKRAVVTAKLVENIFRRYKASNAERERTIRLVRAQNFEYAPTQSDADIRRFMAQLGLDILDDLLALKSADLIASNELAGSAELSDFSKRIQAIRDSGNALSIRELAISGTDLMEELKMVKGPQIGTVLEMMLQAVLEDPKMNNRDSLIELAKLTSNE